MIKVGAKVAVVGSNELKNLGLDDLVGRYGVVIEDESKRKRNSGFWVRLTGDPLYGESEWYIPVKSVTKLTNSERAN